tara:strand:+ start:2180 stop:2359 length:180 start_codon:yes stop_codon:yes gene_type:complete
MKYKIEEDESWYNVIAYWGDGDEIELESFKNYNKAVDYINEIVNAPMVEMMNHLFKEIK